MWNFIIKSLPGKLLLIIAMSLLVGTYIPIEIKSGLYAISMTLKELLMFVMPFIIFSYIYSCLVSFKHGTVSFIGGLLGSICISNFTCALLAYGVCYYALPHLSGVATHTVNGLVLEPMWSFSLPRPISNDMALIAGVLMSVVMSRFYPSRGHELGEKLKTIASWILNRLFIPILPLFVLGFILKVEYEGRLLHAIINYGPVVLLFVSCQILYLIFLFGVSSRFNLRNWYQSMIKAFPAGIVGFSTMSSLASMPVTLRAAQVNSGNNPIVDAVVPATVNVHLIGDSIAIPTMALAILASQGASAPELGIYLIFAFYFVMNKFAVAAVPGGGILVMMPVLQQYLGFSDEMLSLIMMLYILFDAFITMANVLGNSVFALLFAGVYDRLRGLKPKGLTI
jgi:Na+/H+-dicarboxylate symporter